MVLIDETRQELGQIYESKIENSQNLNDFLNSSDPDKQRMQEVTNKWLAKEVSDVKDFKQKSNGFNPLKLLEKTPKWIRAAVASAIIITTNVSSRLFIPSNIVKAEVQNIQEPDFRGSNLEELAEEINQSTLTNTKVTIQFENQTAEIKLDGILDNTTKASLEKSLQENLQKSFEELESGKSGQDDISGGQGSDNLTFVSNLKLDQEIPENSSFALENKAVSNRAQDLLKVDETQINPNQYSNLNQNLRLNEFRAENLNQNLNSDQVLGQNFIQNQITFNPDNLPTDSVQIQTENFENQPNTETKSNNRQNNSLPVNGENLISLDFANLRDYKNQEEIEIILKDLSKNGVSADVTNQLRQYLLQRYNAEQALKQAFETGDYSKLRLRPQALSRLNQIIKSAKEEISAEELPVLQRQQIINEFLKQNSSAALPDLNRALFLGFLSSEGEKNYQEQVNQGIDPQVVWQNLLEQSRTNPALFKTEEEVRQSYLKSLNDSAKAIQGAFSTYRQFVNSNPINSGIERQGITSVGFSSQKGALDLITREPKTDNNFSLSSFYNFSPTAQNTAVTTINKEGNPVTIITSRTFGGTIDNRAPVITNTNIDFMQATQAYKLIVVSGEIPVQTLPSTVGNQAGTTTTTETNVTVINNPNQIRQTILNGQPVQNFVLKNNPQGTNWSPLFQSTLNRALETYDLASGEVNINPENLKDGVNPGQYTAFRGITSWEDLPINTQILLMNGSDLTPEGRLALTLGQIPGTIRMNPKEPTGTFFLFESPGPVFNTPTKDKSTTVSGLNLGIVDSRQVIERTLDLRRNQITVQRFATQVDPKLTTNLSPLSNLAQNTGSLFGAAANLLGFGDPIRKKQNEALQTSQANGLATNSVDANFRDDEGNSDFDATSQAEITLAMAANLNNNSNNTNNVTYFFGSTQRPNEEGDTFAQSIQTSLGSTLRNISGGWNEERQIGDSRYFIRDIKESGTLGGVANKINIESTINGQKQVPIVGYTPFFLLQQARLIMYTPKNNTGQNFSGPRQIPAINLSYAAVRRNQSSLAADAYLQANVGVSMDPLANRTPELEKELDYFDGPNLFDLSLGLNAGYTLAKSKDAGRTARTMILGNLNWNTGATEVQSNFANLTLNQSLNPNPQTRLNFTGGLTYTPQKYYDLIGSISANLRLGNPNNSTNFQIGFETPVGPNARFSQTFDNVTIGGFWQSESPLPTIRRRDPSGNTFGGFLDLGLNRDRTSVLQLNGGYTGSQGQLAPFFGLNLKLDH